jgi:hypothetical protein
LGEAPRHTLDWSVAQGAKILELADKALPIEEIDIASPEEHAWEEIKAIVSSPNMTPNMGIKEVQAILLAMGLVKVQQTGEPASVPQVQADTTVVPAIKDDPMNVAAMVAQSEAYRSGASMSEASRRFKATAVLVAQKRGKTATFKNMPEISSADKTWLAEYLLNPLPRIQEWKAASAAYRAAKASKAA